MMLKQRKQQHGLLGPSGQVAMRKLPTENESVFIEPKDLDFRQLVRQGLPARGLPGEVNSWRVSNLSNLWRGAWRVMLAKTLNLPSHYGTLYLTVTKEDGTMVNYGLASLRVVTTVGVNYIVDAFQNLTELEDMKFHALGTGSGAEAIGDTTLDELTTHYDTDNTRASGTTTEGASANIFRTVGTNTVDEVVGVTEHGIFSDINTNSGVLLDRSLFAIINLSASDSIQSTYDLTITAGS